MSGLSNFVPLRAPGVLVPVLVVIEIVSFLVRPFAICLRFVINIACGHLLLVVFPPLILLPLEIIVCIVQGYVLNLILLI